MFLESYCPSLVYVTEKGDDGKNKSVVAEHGEVEFCCRSIMIAFLKVSNWKDWHANYKTGGF